MILREISWIFVNFYQPSLNHSDDWRKIPTSKLFHLDDRKKEPSRLLLVAKNTQFSKFPSRERKKSLGRLIKKFGQFSTSFQKQITRKFHDNELKNVKSLLLITFGVRSHFLAVKHVTNHSKMKFLAVLTSILFISVITGYHNIKFLKTECIQSSKKSGVVLKCELHGNLVDYEFFMYRKSYSLKVRREN